MLLTKFRKSINLFNNINVPIFTGYYPYVSSGITLLFKILFMIIANFVFGSMFIHLTGHYLFDICYT